MDIKRIKFRRPQNTFRALVSLACIVLVLSLNVPIAAYAVPQAPARTTPPLAKPKHVNVRTGDHKPKAVTPKTTLSENPTDLEIRTSRLFQEPLIPISGQAQQDENSALAAAVNAFKRKADVEDVSALDDFVRDHSSSRWTPSLKNMMAEIKFRTGYISQAFRLWQEVWEQTKKETDKDVMVIANRAVSNLLALMSRLGMKEQLRQGMKEVSNRAFFGSDEEKIDQLRACIWEFDNRPAEAYKCGPLALNTIWNLGKKDKDKHPAVEKFDSSNNGASLVELESLSKQMGMNYVAAKRSKRAPIVIPSVMHWNNHFAAIIGKEDGLYRIQDPTFDSDGSMSISEKAIDEESDGYFLVPGSKPLPSGWHAITGPETKAIKGKGVPLDWGGPSPPECMSGKCCSLGMASADAFAMLGTLRIQDTPLTYSPPVGPNIDFWVQYNYLKTNQPGSFSFTNLGFNWTFNWLAYLTVSGSNVTVRLRDGFSPTYTLSGGVSPADYWDQSILADIGGGVYERRLTDGSIEKYSLSDGGSPAKIFLTEVIDPQGNSILIDYDADFRITQITDAINQVSTISYVSNTSGNSGFYKVASISDPFNRTCSFVYDSTNTNLIKITDAVGLTSEFVYDTGSSMITSMTTDYGTTSFYKYVPGSNPNPARGLRFTFPDGSSSVIESWIGALASTFVWDRHATSLYPNDPANLVYTHCKKTFWQDNISNNRMQPSPQTVTMPLESSPMSYSYDGTANQFYAGTFVLPKQTTRSLGGNGNLVVNAVIEGTPNAGKVATITANWVSASYTVQSGDSTTAVANGLAAAINANTNFRTRGITAGATKNVVSMYSESTALVNGYTYSLTAGSTFTLKLYSQLRQTQEVTYGGTMATGKIVYLYVYYPVSLGGRLTAQYTTLAGDTFATIATNLANQVNADATCQLYNVTAVASGATIKLQSFSKDVQLYGHGTTGQISGTFSKVRNGNTDTIDYERNSIGKVTKVVDQMRRTTSYQYDSNNIDLLEVRETQEGNDYLLGHWEYNSQHLPTKYIDGSAREWDYAYNAVGQPVSVTDPNSNVTTMTYTGTATATIGGSVTTSDVLTITVHDADLTGGQKSVNYTVIGGDTLTSIATGLKNAINADTDLTAIGVSATSSGAVITISSTSVEVTSYTQSTSGGATETISLTANRFGFLTKIDGPLTGNQDITTFSYDSYNRLFTQTDSEGYTLTFYYDDLNRPLKTEYPDGTFEQTKWDRLDACLSRDRNGRWTQRSYDAMDELKFEVDPLGRKTQYTWCNCGSLASLTDANGNTTSWQHDLQGRPTVKTYEDSTTVTYSYQSRVNRLKSTTDALSQIKTFFYNTDGRLYQYNFSLAVNSTPASTFVWDYNYPRMTGSQKNDWGGYTYSYNNYVTSSGSTPITGGGMLSTVQNDVIANSDITYGYDSLGRTTNRSIDGANNSVSWTYDPMSRITTEVNELGTFDYDYVDDAPSASKGTTRLAQITYPNSQVTKFSYFDNFGDQRLQQISNLNPSGATLSQFNYRYDPAGQITQWQQIQNNTSTNYGLGYDKAGQLTSARASGGPLSAAYLKQYQYAYDPGANRTAVHTNSVTRAKLAGTVTTSDVLTITVVDPALSGGQKAVNYTTVGGDTLSTIATKLAAAITADTDLQTLGVNASANGTTINIKSASRNITTYTQSTSGGATETIALNVTDNFIENAVIGGSVTASDVLTIKVIDPALGGGSKSINYTVGGGDSLTTIATGLKTEINNDSSLQSIGVTATSVGPVITIKSTSANATTYDQSVSTGATETIALSVNQNAIETIAIGGSKTTSDTITVVVYDAGLPGGTDSTIYTVQGGDTLSTIASGIATALNSDSDLQSIGLSATASGKIITLRSNSINPTSYRATTSASATETATIGVPANGVQTAAVGGTTTTSDVLTITVYDPGLPSGSKAAQYTVQGGDNLTSIATGLASAINADTDLQAQGVTANSSSAVVNISSASPNLTTYTKSLSGGATETLTLASGINVTQYGHNNVNALTSIAAGGATRFQGNSNKALISATVNSNPVALVWSQEFAGNEATSAGTNNIPVAVTDGASTTKTNNYQITVNSGSSAALTYDANGNMTGDGTNTYVWDADNRLIQINYPGMGNNSQFIFDPMGRNTKIVEVSGGSTTSTRNFVFLGVSPCEERDAAGAVVTLFYGLGQVTGGTNYFWAIDHLSSIREATNDTGVIQAQYTYGPFGEPIKVQGGSMSDFQYARYFTHARSGLFLTLKRPYKPDLARFIQRDIIFESGGINLFRYVENDPMALIDPTGLFLYQGDGLQLNSTGDYSASNLVNDAAGLAAAGAAVATAAGIGEGIGQAIGAAGAGSIPNIPGLPPVGGPHVPPGSSGRPPGGPHRNPPNRPRREPNPPRGCANQCIPPRSLGSRFLCNFWCVLRCPPRLQAGCQERCRLFYPTGGSGDWGNWPMTDPRNWPGGPEAGPPQ